MNKLIFPILIAILVVLSLLFVTDVVNLLTRGDAIRTAVEETLLEVPFVIYETE
jgi:lipopolysaccharide export LptBFGC system permease protein LptF